MRLNITARHFKLSGSMREYIQQEISRLKKYYDGIIDIEVILDSEKVRHLVEIKIMVFGTVLTARDRSDDIRKAINSTVDKLERQILKYKERLKSFEHEKLKDEFSSIESES